MKSSKTNKATQPTKPSAQVKKSGAKKALKKSGAKKTPAKSKPLATRKGSVGSQLVYLGRCSSAGLKEIESKFTPSGKNLHYEIWTRHLPQDEYMVEVWQTASRRYDPKEWK